MRLHDLRYSFASLVLALGATLSVIGRLFADQHGFDAAIALRNATPVAILPVAAKARSLDYQVNASGRS